MVNNEGYTMVPIRPSTKEKLKKHKGIYSYDDEVKNLLEVKEKIKKGKKVTSEDLKIIGRGRIKEWKT